MASFTMKHASLCSSIIQGGGKRGLQAEIRSRSRTLMAIGLLNIVNSTATRSLALMPSQMPMWSTSGPRTTRTRSPGWNLRIGSAITPSRSPARMRSISCSRTDGGHVAGAMPAATSFRGSSQRHDAAALVAV